MGGIIADVAPSYRSEVGRLCLQCGSDNIRKRGKEPEVALSARQVQQATSVLDFLDSFAPMPVRISHIGRHKAIATDFEKVPFEQYLYVDNLFQGYLNTQQNGGEDQAFELLLQMAQVLYANDKVKPTMAHLVGRYPPRNTR